ncbi:MAG TPA: ATP-binding protein [Allosphingosinicella sp.]|jgi:nitrogen fixation/metabolism regulation signal transduction histidine kinase
MGFRGRFLAGLAGRAALLVLGLILLIASFWVDGLAVARLLAGAFAGWSLYELWRFIQRTNVELARFLEAIRLHDLSQSFAHVAEGSGFTEIGQALDDSIRGLREERLRLTGASRFCEAVLDDAPTPLLTIDDGRIELANKAARRLFQRHQGVRIEDFTIYGTTFAQCLRESSAGPARLVPLMIEGLPQTAMVSAATVHRLGILVRVVAVQPIQGELNAVELAAQSDLVRVLTHEIMNSMTPVTSLAHTAASLMVEADRGGGGAVHDARLAVETLARRAEGVMGFVGSYRQISKSPEVRRRSFEAGPWARELEALFRAGHAADGVDFTLNLSSDRVILEADPDLLCQVLINLLRNAADAARDHSSAPAASLSLARLAAGRVQIDVEDNGPGVPEALRQDVFLPFFTTKANGSGVGLSLARQVVLAHRGSIGIGESEMGGARFRILL